MCGCLLGRVIRFNMMLSHQISLPVFSTRQESLTSLLPSQFVSILSLSISVSFYTFSISPHDAVVVSEYQQSVSEKLTETNMSQQTRFRLASNSMWNDCVWLYSLDVA